MIIYSSDVAGFKNDIFEGRLIDSLDRQIARSYKASSYNERLSWQNSLHFMNTIITNSNVPDDAGVAIEYMIPTTSKRIDFLVSGYDDEDQPNVVVIELKQWSSVETSSESRELVKVYINGCMRSFPHPSYQAWSYTALLKDYNASVQDGSISLHPCAYLHNYISELNDPLRAENFTNLLKESPFFDQHDGRKLCDFLNKFIRKGDHRKILYYIDNGRIRPSKSLQDNLVAMLKGNDAFVMIDDQKVVYENAIAMAEKTRRDHKKRVMIVEGGPGTGKSVLAINLLAELTNRDMVAQYITKNSAPRKVYKTKLKGSRQIHSIDNLFKNSSGYYDIPENTIDIAIVDEAHRLNAKSGFYGNQGENQVMEIIRASKCSVFFVDDHQVITLKDIGESEEIRKQAMRMGAIILEEQLHSQFRCNGSDGYIAWLEDVLQIRETANKYFDLDYDFGVVDSPHDLLNWVIKHNVNNKARIVAGYCWDWPTRTRNDKRYHDITIPEHNFGMSWNLEEGIWAIDPDSVYEAGCIHTSQGLEFEYIGVIIGPDMYFDGTNVCTDASKRASTDQSLKGLKQLAETNPELAEKRADLIIRNTYRTLLTRGLKGCRVFCTDKALGEYIKSRMKKQYRYLVYPSQESTHQMAAEESEPYEKSRKQ
jgi:DUF2075 family protein